MARFALPKDVKIKWFSVEDEPGPNENPAAALDFFHDDVGAIWSPFLGTEAEPDPVTVMIYERAHRRWIGRPVGWLGLQLERWERLEPLADRIFDWACPLNGVTTVLNGRVTDRTWEDGVVRVDFTLDEHRPDDDPEVGPSGHDLSEPQ